MEQEISQNKQDINLQKLMKQREKGIVATSSIGIGGNVVLVAIKAIIVRITAKITNNDILFLLFFLFIINPFLLCSFYFFKFSFSFSSL